MCLCAALLWLPAVGLAEPAPPGAWGDPLRGPNHALGVELGMTSRDGLRDTQRVLSPRLSGHYRWLADLRLELDWGAVLVQEVGDAGPSATTTASGNPMLGLRYRLLEDARGHLSASFGWVGPLAWLGQDALRGQRRAGFAMAAGMRGLWDAWLWAPSQTGGAAGAVYSRTLGGVWSMLLEADVGWSYSIGDVTTVSTYDLADIYGQLAIDLSGRAAPHGGVTGGLRLQAVAMGADGDQLQLAMMPHVGLRWPGAALDLSWLINLDPPLGVFGAGLDVWGLLLRGEVRL